MSALQCGGPGIFRLRRALVVLLASWITTGLLHAQSCSWKPCTVDAEFSPRDGAGALVFGGKLWLLGGWTPATSNEVWSSVDGRAWTLETVAPWEPRHTAGYCVYQGNMWIVGGDANLGHYQNDVWRSPDGVQWFRVTDNVPWGPRVLHHTVVFDGRIWVMGGQTLPQFAPAAEAFYDDVWYTTNGVDWTRAVEHAPWAARGMIGGSVVFDSRIWLIGGGTYNTPGQPYRNFYNDVWSSTNGVDWVEELDSAPWEPRQYHDIALFDGRMWVLEGYHGYNLSDVWSSENGVDWTELPGTPWPARHAASVFVDDDRLWIVAGNQWNDAWRLTCPSSYVAVPFVRGDCDDDAELSIADAVHALSAAFGLGAMVACDAACDVNADGSLDLADAVSLLGYLFAEGAPPPPPHPDCGTGGVPESCAAFDACP